MLKDIKRITAELAGKMPAECIEITDLLFRHKYTAFSASSYALSIWLICMTELPSYKAKNLKNTVNYEYD